MDVDRSELRRGLARTRRYLLSHHDRSEWYRCYSPRVFGRRVRLCGRCLGVYPGILLGLLAPAFGNDALAVLVVAGLPLPALVDWAATTFTARRGYNPVRTATGAALGYAYGTGLVGLFVHRDPWVLAVGAAYALVAGGLVAASTRT